MGNSIDIDNSGNYYIGDIGPDTRIIKIDPNTNEVTTWADDSQWTDGGFGTGGMVWNESDGFYVAHAGALWYVPQNMDGTAGAAEAVSLTGTTAIDGSNAVNADGMTWAGNNTLFYAENDAFVPGWAGIVHRIELEDATTGVNSNYIEGINDCSGVYFGNFEGQDYLYVGESQFGVAFGVNFVPPSNPFCVKTYAVNDIVSSVSDQEFLTSLVSVYPNPATDRVQVRLKNEAVIERLEIYTTEGRLISKHPQNTSTGDLNIVHLDSGAYLLKVLLADGQHTFAKLLVQE